MAVRHPKRIVLGMLAAPLRRQQRNVLQVASLQTMLTSSPHTHCLAFAQATAQHATLQWCCCVWMPAPTHLTPHSLPCLCRQRRNTLQVAILGQLQKPPAGFEEAIRCVCGA